MRDPIDALTALTPGGTVEQPGAAEIRRRGDARRRRRMATTVLGALVAAAAVIVPVSLLNRPDLPIEPATSDSASTNATDEETEEPTTSFVTEIPDGLTLTPSAEDLPGWTWTTAVTSLGEIDLCGQQAFAGDDVLDRLAIDGESSGEEVDTAGRELRLYPDDIAARAAVEGLINAVTSCERDQRDDGTTWVHVPASRGEPLGESEAAFTRTHEVDGSTAPGVELWTMVQVGNAVVASYVDLEHGSLDDGIVLDGLPVVSPELVQQMCVFTAAGCEPGDATDEPTGAESGAIPADFPIDRYLPTGPDITQIDPRAGDDGIEICGEWIWPAGAQETAGVMAIGPEMSETRWLGVFATTGQAITALDAARSVLNRCSTTGADDTLAVSVLDVTSGHDDVTFAVVAADGRPGGEVIQLVRVGSAILVSSSGGEYTLASAQAAAQQLSEQSADLATEMCVFTEAGCG